MKSNVFQYMYLLVRVIYQNLVSTVKPKQTNMYITAKYEFLFNKLYLLINKVSRNQILN